MVSAIAGSITLWLLGTGELRAARLSASVAVAAVVGGWGVAQYPWLLVGEVDIAEAAASSAVLTGLVVAFAIAVVLVVPPLVYLLVLADSNRVGTE